MSHEFDSISFVLVMMCCYTFWVGISKLIECFFTKDDVPLREFIFVFVFAVAVAGNINYHIRTNTFEHPTDALGSWILNNCN